jgi:hypothetical protein
MGLCVGRKRTSIEDKESRLSEKQESLMDI